MAPQILKKAKSAFPKREGALCFCLHKEKRQGQIRQKTPGAVTAPGVFVQDLLPQAAQYRLNRNTVRVQSLRPARRTGEGKL